MRSPSAAVLVSVGILLALQIPAEASPWGGWRNVGSEISKGLSTAGREIESAASKVATEVSNIASQGQQEVKNFAQSVESVVQREPEPDPEELPAAQPTFAPRAPVLLGCPPLADPTLEVTCLKDGRVDCRQKMERDTVAKVACKAPYKLPEPYPGYVDVSCGPDYAWSRPLFKCVPDCGKRNGPTKMAGGVKVPQLQLPWTIGVFKVNGSGSRELVCSGSLIKDDLVLTAASCFWDSALGSKLDAVNFKVLAGSYEKQWPVGDDASVQTSGVLEVVLHERFSGRARRLGYNIAVVRLAQPLRLTRSVNVVCMDWNPRQQDAGESSLAEGDNGLVSSWGNALANASSPSNAPVQLPYLPALSCSDTIDDAVQDYLTPDKVCAGSDAAMAVCPEDTGAGYVFPLDMVQGKRYFLRAVASAPFVDGDTCATQKLAIFTYLSAHVKWVNKIVFAH